MKYNWIMSLHQPKLFLYYKIIEILIYFETIQHCYHHPTTLTSFSFFIKSLFLFLSPYLSDPLLFLYFFFSFSSSLLLFNYLLLLLWFYDLVFDLLNLVIYCISPFLGHFILLWITDLQSYMKSSAASTAMSLWWLFNSG